MSQLINDHRSPSENIIIRVELHSNKAIPAIAWYKLIEREKEHYIITNKTIRKQEEKHVSNRLTYVFLKIRERRIQYSKRKKRKPKFNNILCQAFF
jgi:hypothetical protein